jgi:hypothetical protein
MDEPFSGTKRDRSASLFCGFRASKTRFQPLGSDHDGLRVCSIVILPLYRRLNVMLSIGITV